MYQVNLVLGSPLLWFSFSLAIWPVSAIWWDEQDTNTDLLSVREKTKFKIPGVLFWASSFPLHLLYLQPSWKSFPPSVMIMEKPNYVAIREYMSVTSDILMLKKITSAA